MKSTCDVKTPEGLSIYRGTQDELEGRLWLLFRGILWKMHLVSHTPKRMDHRRPSICAGKGANVITSECGLDTSYGLAHIQASCSTNRSKKFKGFPRRLDSTPFLLGLTSGASRFLWPGEKFWPLPMTVLKQVTNEMTPSVNLGLRVSLVPS